MAPSGDTMAPSTLSEMPPSTLSENHVIPDNLPPPAEDDRRSKGTCRDRIGCEYSRRSRDFWTYAIGFILLMIGMVCLVFVLYDHPSLVGKDKMSVQKNVTKDADDNALAPSRNASAAYYRELRLAVIHQIHHGLIDPYVFVRPNSPQRMAMQWMAFKDPLHLPLNGSRWIQRYALMTIYFANDGDKWTVFAGDSSKPTALPNTNIQEEQQVVAAIVSPKLSSVVHMVTENGSPWSEQAGIHECQFALVQCDKDDRVVSAAWSGDLASLSGTLIKEIGLLSHLRHLDVSQNQLRGKIPKELFDLTHLERLDLSFNEFVSTIDPLIGRFSNLTHLNLKRTHFSGQLPSTLQDLTNLEVFHMGSNPEGLGGPVLNYAVHWKNVKVLELLGSATWGTIPSELGLLTQLTGIAFLNTFVSGTIPTELGQLKALKQIYLGSNYPSKSVVGTLPTEIGSLTSLEVFSCQQVELTGTIPSEVGKWSNVKTFHLWNSGGIQGTLPSELGRMTKLRLLWIFDTEISGAIPSELGLLSDASEMKFHSTKLEGTMPEEICDLPLQSLSADCSSSVEGSTPELVCEVGTCCSECYST
ncbi:Fibronectin leucine rich transmembrane protein 2 [Seminavis robusta]|uniref:Fibronectin leucine rich transmembrane protein 2 n=1 Tax=Seminavis robusta TaxID=568900 RepID=A0A9N8H3C0_9STRA|nr:Fibronectin leucine rich transmembrane protein 2 [Seminavis robusta]|eukprot:Sro56_g032980.1 Fibronectin leucine rich transmembrane protein 2 (585) ;mRNA; r:119985-122232